MEQVSEVQKKMLPCREEEKTKMTVCDELVYTLVLGMKGMENAFEHIEDCPPVNREEYAGHTGAAWFTMMEEGSPKFRDELIGNWFQAIRDSSD